MSNVSGIELTDDIIRRYGPVKHFAPQVLIRMNKTVFCIDVWML